MFARNYYLFSFGPARWRWGIKTLSRGGGWKREEMGEAQTPPIGPLKWCTAVKFSSANRNVYFWWKENKVFAEWFSLGKGAEFVVCIVGDLMENVLSRGVIMIERFPVCSHVPLLCRFWNWNLSPTVILSPYDNNHILGNYRTYILHELISAKEWTFCMHWLLILI